MLTPDQMTVLKDLASVSGSTPPIGKLVALASDWDVPFAQLVNAYADSAPARPTPSASASPATPVRQQVWETASWNSPVAHVHAAEGSIAVLPPNFVLIEARLKSGLSVREIAYHAGIKVAVYKRLEDGTELPHPDVAARISALLSIPVERLFVAAAASNMTANTLKGFSVIGFLRAKKRMTPKQLAEAISDQTGRHIKTSLLTALEAGRPLPKHDSIDLSAIAAFLDVPVQMLSRRLPPSLAQQAGEYTQQLHNALKAIPSDHRLEAANILLLEEKK